jgi:hypothetical protein
MGTDWASVEAAMRSLPAYVREAGLWTTAVDLRPVTDELIATVRRRVEETYGTWQEEVRS